MGSRDRAMVLTVTATIACVVCLVTNHGTAAFWFGLLAFCAGAEA